MMVDGVVGGGQGQASVGSGARVACSHIHAWVNVLPKNDLHNSPTTDAHQGSRLLPDARDREVRRTAKGARENDPKKNTLKGRCDSFIGIAICIH